MLKSDPLKPLSIAASIASLAQLHPDRRAITFYTSGIHLSWGEIDREARKTAIHLRNKGIEPGDIVLVAGEHDQQLVTALIGVLYGGAVPAMVPYASSIHNPILFLDRIVTLVEESGAKAVLDSTLAPNEQLPSRLNEIKCQVVTLPQGDLPGPVDTGLLAGLTLAPEAPAYIQFSSGTTGDPKGALVSQGAWQAYVPAMSEALDLREADVMVNWIPYYHDMGLIISLLYPLVAGIPAVTMPPAYWVRHPVSILKALHDFRGSICFMPNFGFAHILRHARPEDLNILDLRCVRILAAGTELVQKEVMRAFADRMADCGLAPQALRTAYGMTEATCMVTLTREKPAMGFDEIDPDALMNRLVARPSDRPDAQAVACCGSPVKGVQLSIVDPEGKPLPERHIGELVLAGATLFDHYQNRPDLTEEALRLGRFHTGDLAYLADGELYVVDRKKDLIISAGNHIYPEALERVAEQLVGPKGGRAVVFGVYDRDLGTEMPVLVCEIRGRIDDGDAQKLAEMIGQQVKTQTGITLADVRLVRRGWPVLTTSGKIARHATREKYLSHGFRPVSPGLRLLQQAGDHPQKLEQALCLLAAERLEVAEVQPDDDLFAIGGDSLGVVSFVMAVENTLKIRVEPRFFDAPRVRDLVHWMGQMTGRMPEGDVKKKSGPRSWASVRSPRSFKQKIRDRLVGVGPMWHGHALPYWLGVRIQRWIFSSARLRNQLFPREMAAVEQWIQQIGSVADPETIFLRSALANTWTLWRKKALQEPRAWSRWVEVFGMEHLIQAEQEGTGLVLGFTRSLGKYQILKTLNDQFPSIFPERVAFLGLQDRSGSGGSDWMDGMPEDWPTYRLYQAHRVLQDGGWAMIAIDGDKGRRGKTVDFWGRQATFYRGAASLAVENQCPLVPIFPVFTAEGRICIEILPPLPLPQAEREEAIQILFDQGLALIKSRFSQDLGDLWWNHLARLWQGEAHVSEKSGSV